MATEYADLWCWENRANGRPWTAGEWDPDWPTETFTQGQALPDGLLSSLGTFHNQAGKDHRFALLLNSEPQGFLPVIWVPFRDVRYEKPEGREFSVRGECGVFYHRMRDGDPIHVKIEAPDGDGAGLYRIYTWWYGVKKTWQRTNGGPWVPA